LVPHLATLEHKRIERYVYGLTLKCIQKAVQIVGALIDEALRNGSIKKNPENKGNVRKPSKDRNVRDNNKRTRTGNVFATTGQHLTEPVNSLALQPGAAIGLHITTRQKIHQVDLEHRFPGERPSSTKFWLNNLRGSGSWKPWEPRKGKGIHVGSKGGSSRPKHCNGYVYSKRSYAAPTLFEQLRILVEREVRVSGHVISGDEFHVDPSKIEAVKNWEAPRTPTEKSKTFDWGEEQELAFQTLKDKLCNAPVLALLYGLEDFVVYCDTFSLQHIISQKELNMRQHHWIELFSDYEYKILYHPGKANVVADALSRKERVKPKRVRAMNMTF
ncbi:putative reverse transcriptase domain-containing protein, partial [Tanacetum coccineum]